MARTKVAAAPQHPVIAPRPRRGGRLAAAGARGGGQSGESGGATVSAGRNRVGGGGVGADSVVAERSGRRGWPRGARGGGVGTEEERMRRKEKTRIF